MKPLLLVHPPLGGFEARLSETYDVVHWPQAEARAGDIRAALTIGSTGLTNAMIDALPQLGLIACFGAGYDGIDVSHAHARNVVVTNCPNVNNEDVADVALGLMISTVRKLALGDANVRAGKWRDGIGYTQRFTGMKTGIVGLGAIGMAIADRAFAFKHEIAWQGPRPKPDSPYRYEPDLIELAKWADILVIACPALPGTEKMISAEVIEALGPQGVLVNIARGSIVDEDALIAALKSGKLGGAGLDVFEEEPTPAARWADVPNTALMPHQGGGSFQAIRATTQLALENLELFFVGEPVKTPVKA